MILLSILWKLQGCDSKYQRIADIIYSIILMFYCKKLLQLLDSISPIPTIRLVKFEHGLSEEYSAFLLVNSVENS